MKYVIELTAYLYINNFVLHSVLLLLHHTNVPQFTELVDIEVISSLATTNIAVLNEGNMSFYMYAKYIMK